MLLQLYFFCSFRLFSLMSPLILLHPSLLPLHTCLQLLSQFLHIHSSIITSGILTLSVLTRLYSLTVVDFVLSFGVLRTPFKSLNASQVSLTQSRISDIHFLLLVHTCTLKDCEAFSQIRRLFYALSALDLIYSLYILCQENKEGNNIKVELLEINIQCEYPKCLQ